MTSALSSTRLPCGNRVLDLAHTHVMGILNVTPDSFSDGGRFSQVDAALRHAEAMVAAGATLIDVGGESTRPGARVVSPLEELERVAPVVERIARELDVIISVDTSTPAVMRETARLGAGLINDVRSLRRDGALDAAAAIGLPVCLMHMQGEPGNMQDDPHYSDLVGEVSGFLADRIAQCVGAGIAPEKIILDPGFGFAKTLEHNLSLFYAQAAQTLEPAFRVVKVNTEASQDIATRFAIRSIPTLALFQNGMEVARQPGAVDANTIVSWARSKAR